MRFKVQSKQVRCLSKRQLTRVYDTGMREATRHPTLVRLIMQDYESEEECRKLLVQFATESEQSNAALYVDREKLPRKRKKYLKRKLTIVHNAYVLTECLLIMFNEQVKK